MHVLIDGTMLDTADAHCGIGLYLRQLLSCLRDREISIRWSLVAAESMIGDLVPMPLRQRLELLPIVPQELLQARLGKPAGLERTLQRYAQEKKVTHYWHPAPLHPQAIFPAKLSGVRHLVTLAGNPLEDVRGRLPARQLADLNSRAQQLPHWADAWSAPTDDELAYAVQRYGMHRSAGTVLRWPTEIRTSHSPIVPAPYLLVCGAVGRTSEAETVLRAFCRFTSDAENPWRLVFLSRISAEDRRQLVKLSEELGIASQVVWTGYVEQAARNALLVNAAGILSPQTPGPLIAVASAAGIPVVRNEQSGGLCGSADLSVSFQEMDGLIQAMSQLTAWQETERVAPVWQSWEETAFQHAEWLRQRQATPAVKHRRRLAYVSPWPPQPTGIADYGSDMVPRLAQQADVTVYQPSLDPTDEMESRGISVKPLTALCEDRSQVDSVIYHIGNNVPFHQGIYSEAWTQPGVMVLHDYNLHGLISGAFLHAGNPKLYYEAVRECGTLVPGEFDPMAVDIFAHPLSQGIVRRSVATIVHNAWTRQQLADCGTVVTIPHGGFVHDPPTDEAIYKLREQFGLHPEEFIVTSLGFANALKRIDVILQAVSRLVMQGYPIRFVIGGAITDENSPIAVLIAQLKLEDHVLVTGYLDDEQFDTLVGISDVVLNLRYPSVGESSGTLLKAFGHSRACIVSDYQQFAELPDDICWKVPVSGWELPVLTQAIAKLLEDPALREQMGQAAASFVQRWWSYDRAAQQYLDLLDQVNPLAVA